MKILIADPTDLIGRQIVRELMAPEFSVRVILSEPSLLAGEFLTQLEIVHGSVDDEATLRRALEGVEAFCFHMPTVMEAGASVDSACERFARMVAREIRAARTQRIVTISIDGWGRVRHAGNVSVLETLEDLLNESSAPIRHLRCGVAEGNLAHRARENTGRARIPRPVPGPRGTPLVTAEDVTNVALRWLVRRDWRGVERQTVCGSEWAKLPDAPGESGNNGAAFQGSTIRSDGGSDGTAGHRSPCCRSGCLTVQAVR
jgi:uncharacterized protein YbjT (DUF2867 family)